MYRCIIIDDEPIAIRVIRNHLSSFPDFEIIAECNNALEAITVLAKQKVDLMFCDIQMPQLTGVDFVRTLSHPPKVIFTTAYRDYAIDAFELQVIDYLLKPVSFERFAKAIHHFLEQSAVLAPSGEPKSVEPEKEFIFLKADKKHYKVNLCDLLYFESMGDYVIAYTSTQKIVSKERISHLSEELPPDKFIQIHRGYVVSIEKIDSVGPGFVEINKKKFPIGRNYKEQLNKLLGK